MVLFCFLLAKGNFMKKIISTAALGILLAGTHVATAVADDNLYAGVNYEMWSWDDEGAKPKPSYLTGKIGKKLNDGFSVEGKLGVGISDDTDTTTFDILGTTHHIDLNIDPKLYAGVFGVFSNDLNDSFEVYAKGGLNYVSFDAKATDRQTGISEKETISETKVAIGAGANFFFNGKSGINFEILAPSVADLGDMTTISFGYIQKF